MITRGFQLVYGPIAFRSRDIFTEAEPGMPRDSEPEVKVIVDPSVMGGLVSRIGDTVIDGSVRHRLEQMKERHA